MRFLFKFTPSPQPSPQGGLCRKGENGKNVMLNLFQHLINSMSYETLNQVQGDKKAIVTQSQGERGRLGNGRKNENEDQARRTRVHAD